MANKSKSNSDTFEKTVASEYDELTSTRSSYIKLAQKCALLTLTSLYPDENIEGDKPFRELPDPHTSVGAEGVKNLASKLLMTQFPTESTIFRTMLSPTSEKELEEAYKDNKGELEKTKKEIERALSKIEQAVLRDMEVAGDRRKLGMMNRLSLVQGNVVVDQAKEGLRLIQLPNFVVKRDPSGVQLRLIIKETVAPEALRLREPQLVEALEKDPDYEKDLKSNSGYLTMYTAQVLEDGKYKVWQEVGGKKLPTSIGQYPLNAPRFIVVAPLRQDGEHYGRPFVEEVLGDLASLNVLTKAIKDGAKAAARLLLFVDPNGQTNVSDMNNAVNGLAIPGKENDVSVLDLGKSADFRVAVEVARDIEKRLAEAFLRTSSIQRQAERVTAEEMRIMASELDAALGGFYSIMAYETTRPYVMRKILRLKKEGSIPQIRDIFKVTDIVITTGLQALGRGHERNRIMGFTQGVTQALGPEGAQFLKKHSIVTRLATAEGLSVEDFVRNEDEVSADTAQQQQDAMTQTMMPEVIKQAGPIMANMQQQQQEGA